MTKILTRVVLPLVIVLIAFSCAAAMIVLRPSAERAVPEARIPRVEVVEVTARPAVARLQATGLVQPARQVALTSEVSGRVVWQAEDLVPGGRVSKGQLLARLDDREYAMRVEQAKSAVNQAEVELELEKGRQRVAAREWALLGQGRSEDEAPLAMRKPQLAAAEQAVASANSGLEQAELNLERTRLRAPFNAVILDEGIDQGQVVGPGTVAATLVGSDEVWVKVAVPVDQLPAVVLPNGKEPGSKVHVEQRLGQTGVIAREGTVTQLLAQLDPQTRTAQLLVTIPDPMATEEGGLPLLPGAYVDVTIEGRILQDTLSIPRTALDGGDRVWVVAEDGTLSSHTVEIGWRNAEQVILVGGLESGARVVTSPMALPIEGMKVETLTDNTQAEL